MSKPIDQEREAFDLAYQRAVDNGWVSTKDLARYIWEQACAQLQPAGVEVLEGYRLIRIEHFDAIEAQTSPNQVDAYRGRNIYDDNKVYRNWRACESALDDIKDVFQQIEWDAKNELPELLEAAQRNEQTNYFSEVKSIE